MAIRQIVSRSIKDGTIVDADLIHHLVLVLVSFKERMVLRLQHQRRVTSFV